MKILTASMLQMLSTEKKRQFEGLLPQIIKKLIIAGTSDLSGLRIPSGNDIWASGFDGIVSCAIGNTYVAEGTSVWEFGTNNKSLEKIESDYAKRTENPLGIDRSETTFYLVIPKIWAYKKALTQWEVEHTDWKSVHVYDASVLCDWINEEPTVLSWLLEVLFEETVDFSNVDQAWKLFSKKTEPALSLELFLKDRNNEIDGFNSLLDQPIIRVKADSFIDSIGFALGALMQNRELREKSIVVYDAVTYKTISSLVKRKIILLNFTCTQDIIPTENSVIICYNKEAISIKPDIQLNPCSKYHYYHAFRKMGLNDSETHELYAFCHGNLNALVRRIPGIANEHMPAWAVIEDKLLLEPIVYLRTINSSCDRELVEKITSTPYERVEEFYKSLLQKEDSPIKRVEDNYLIINYEEAWSVLGYRIDDLSFDRFHASVKWFFEVLRTDGLYSGRFGQFYMIKQHIHFLLLNYIYYSFSADDSFKLSEAVNELLLFSSDDRLSKLLIENLSVLAEAAPLTVLEFLEKECSDEQSRVLSLFSAGDIFHEYTGVLSALDELTLYRQTSIRTCKLLFSLYQKGYEYKIINSPIDSLLTALCLFNSEVALTIQHKRELLCYFYRIDSYHACELICMLLGKDSFWKSVRYGEHHNDAHSQLTNQEIIATSEFIANMVFDYCETTGEVSIFQSLLKEYNHVRPEFMEDKAHHFSIKAFCNQDLIPVVFQLKERIYSIQKYQITEEQTYLPALKLWTALLLSGCSETERDDWMFVRAYECPSELLLDCKDIFSKTEQERSIRIEKLRDILQKTGASEILRLTKRMDNDPYWGTLLSVFIDDVPLHELIKVLVHNERFAVIGGLIDALSIENAQIVYTMVNGDSQIKTLPYISRIDFSPLLKTEVEMKEYWNHQVMRSFSTEWFEQMLHYNPQGLLLYFYEKMEKEPLASIEQAKTVISAIASSDFDYSRNDEYLIAETVKRIDSLDFSDEWARTTLQLYIKGFVQEMPLSSKVFFFHNPYSLVDYVSKDSAREYLERRNFTLPENAYDEYSTLTFFIDTLINSGKKILAGNIIGRIPCGEDGVRLSNHTCELLEHVDDREFDIAVMNSIINSIGVRTITDGTDQKALSAKYLKDASEAELFYPHAAFVLRELSQFFLSVGKQEYIYSEIYD